MAYCAEPPRPSEISHQVAIDAISTLGATAVSVLLAEHDRILGWPEVSRQQLREFADLRSASVARVKAEFPDQFGMQSANEATDFAGPIPQESLQEVTLAAGGAMPVLITAPHNGWRKQLGAHELQKAPHSKASDGATRFIAQDVHRFLQQAHFPTPTVLVDSVHRAYRTPQTRVQFEYDTYRTLCALRQQTDAPILHLDIHGFGMHQEITQFDLVLGTNHRQTVGASHADLQLAELTNTLGYRTYLPGSEPQPGEIYTARSPATLVRRVADLGIAQVASIQVEISPDFRTADKQEAGEQLARDLGNFCLAWR